MHLRFLSSGSISRTLRGLCAALCMWDRRFSDVVVAPLSSSQDKGVVDAAAELCSADGLVALEIGMQAGSADKEQLWFNHCAIHIFGTLPLLYLFLERRAMSCSGLTTPQPSVRAVAGAPDVPVSRGLPRLHVTPAASSCHARASACASICGCSTSFLSEIVRSALPRTARFLSHGAQAVMAARPSTRRCARRR